MAMARVVTMTTTRGTKKVRAMRARATRAMMETSQREEGNDGPPPAITRTVMARTVRAMRTASRGMATAAITVMTVAKMMQSGNKRTKQQC